MKKQILALISSVLALPTLFTTQAISEVLPSEALIDRIRQEAGSAFENGDLDRADRLLRSTIAEAPNHISLRMDQILLLVRSGQYDAAAWQARALQAEGLDGPAADLLETFLRDYDMRPSQSVSFGFALEPSSNATKGTSEETITIGSLPFRVDSGSQAQSGTGLSLDMNAWKRWQLSERWTLRASATAVATIRKDSDVSHSASLKQRLSFRYRKIDQSLEFGPIAQLSFQNGDVSRRQLGGFIRVARDLSHDTQLSFELESFSQDFPVQSFRNGNLVDGRLSWARTLSSGSRLELYIPFEREKTDRKHLNHQDLGLGVRYSFRPTTNIGLTLGGEYVVDRYDGAFPGVDFSRRDERSRLSIGFTHDGIQWNEISPRVEYTFTNSNSNIPLYDYQSHDFSLTFRRVF